MKMIKKMKTKKKKQKELQSIVHIVYQKIKHLITVETKTMKFLEGNKGEKYLLPEFGKDFIDDMNMTLR